MEIVSVITWTLVLFAGASSDIMPDYASRAACVAAGQAQHRKWECHPVMKQKIVRISND